MLLPALWMVSASAGIYKCEDFDGRIRYSEEPCTSLEKQLSIRVPQEPVLPATTLQQQPKALNLEDYLKQIYQLGQCSGHAFARPDLYSEADRQQRSHALRVLRQQRQRYAISETRFASQHNAGFVAYEKAFDDAAEAYQPMLCRRRSQDLVEHLSP